MLGTGPEAAAAFARNDRPACPQEIVTVEGGEAIPLAITTSVSAYVTDQTARDRNCAAGPG
jgi:hypothetical protein